MIYFISGHRDLTKKEFESRYIPVINNVLITDRNAEFILGNSPGCDTFAIEYLDNNKALFKIYPYEEFIPKVKFGIISDKRFNTWQERDAYLTLLSSYDIAFVKEGKTDSGTAANILRRHKF